MWSSIHRQYVVTDADRLAMLLQVCEAEDQAQACHAQIEKDGVVQRTEAGGLKDHPALKHELANRAFVVRTLARLGLSDAGKPKPVGRPPTPLGWLGPESEFDRYGNPIS